MRTCSLCRAQSPDAARQCVRCGADLAVHSATAVALSTLRANLRVSTVRLIVHEDACPACRQVEGEYSKDTVPGLPVHGCSHSNGCRCFYQPMLTEIFP